MASITTGKSGLKSRIFEAPTQPAQPPGGFQVPEVVINEKGLLELPYSPAWSDALIQFQQEYNQAVIEGKNEKDALDQQLTTDKRTAESEMGEARRQTLDNHGSRGLAFSSGYVGSVNKIAGSYLNKLNQIDLNTNNAKRSIDTDLTGRYNNFLQQQQRDAIKYGEELSEKAGTLGYGTQAPPSGSTAPQNQRTTNRTAAARMTMLRR